MTPKLFDRWVDESVGPIVVQADGTVIEKKMPPAEAEGTLQSRIAGGGFEPPTSGL